MNRLAYDIAQALPELRREAEGRMVDECIIRRPGGRPTFDPDTGDYIDPPEATLYSGKCEVQISDGLSAREGEAGGTELTTRRLTLKLPVSATGIRKGDLVEITASRNDPSLVGADYRVAAGHAKSWATARRLHVEEVTT